MLARALPAGCQARRAAHQVASCGAGVWRVGFQARACLLSLPLIWRCRTAPAGAAAAYVRRCKSADCSCWGASSGLRQAVLLWRHTVWPARACPQIAETLTRFGVNEGCQHLLVARFDATPEQARRIFPSPVCSPCLLKWPLQSAAAALAALLPLLAPCTELPPWAACCRCSS